MYQRAGSRLTAVLRAVFASALTVLLLSLFAPSVHADAVYATTFYLNSQLLEINLSNGAGTPVDVVPGSIEIADLASFDGRLYSLDQTHGLFDEINPATASVITSTSLGVTIGGEGGFTFDNSGNAFVSVPQGPLGTTGQLFECNVTVNNGCTAIGSSTLIPSMDGLAVNAAGVLYGMSQSPTGDASPSLYIINMGTGAATLIGSTGQVGNDLGGLAFDPDNGVLYSAFNGELYTINTSNGAATAVGSIGFTNISGLAFLGPSTSAPEPGTSSLMLIGVASLGLMIVARKRIRPGHQQAT